MGAKIRGEDAHKAQSRASLGAGRWPLQGQDLGPFFCPFFRSLILFQSDQLQFA